MRFRAGFAAGANTVIKRSFLAKDKRRIVFLFLVPGPQGTTEVQPNYSAYATHQIAWVKHRR